jgi:hypothetical protein
MSYSREEWDFHAVCWMTSDVAVMTDRMRKWGSCDSGYEDDEIDMSGIDCDSGQSTIASKSHIKGIGF